MGNQGDTGSVSIGSKMPAVGQDGESYEFDTRDGEKITVSGKDVLDHTAHYTGAEPGQPVEIASRVGCGVGGEVQKWIGPEVVQEFTPEEESGDVEVLVPVNEGEVCEDRQVALVSVDDTNGPSNMEFSYFDMPTTFLVAMGAIATLAMAIWIAFAELRPTSSRSSISSARPQKPITKKGGAPTLDEILAGAGKTAEPVTQDEEEPEETVTYQDMIDDLNEVRIAYANAVTFSGPQREYIFTAPAILDSSVPATAAFIEAMTAADLKFYDSMDFEAEADRSTVRAVEKAVEAWDEAVAFARLNMKSSINPRHHERVRALLEIILRSEDDNAEAMNARDRLVDILSDITYDIPTVGTSGVTTRALSGENMVDLGKIKDARSISGGSHRLQIESA